MYSGNIAILKKSKCRGAHNDKYNFDVEKCKICHFRGGCYKEGSKSKTYCVTIKSTEHLEQEAFQNTEEFKQLAKERYKIEAKNSELKGGHGYDKRLAGVFLAWKYKEPQPYLRST